MIALPLARPPVARTVADLLLFAAQAWSDAEASVFPDERIRIVSPWPMSATKIQRSKLRSDLLAGPKG